MLYEYKKYKRVYNLFESQVPTFNVSTVNWKNRARMFSLIFDRMIEKRGAPICLEGGTGIGKTTFVKQLALILGMDALIIEVPHISTEQVINIPYIVTRKDQKMSSTIKSKDIETARSYLSDRCNLLKKSADQKYLADMETWPEDTKALYKSFNQEMLRKIKVIRQKYSGILFLDEYYRKTSKEVRQVLRQLLEHKIGQDALPADIFVITASNMKDVGQSVEKLEGNTVHRGVQYKAPNKDEFFYYLQSRGTPIKKAVLDAFYPIIESEHLDYDDDSEVRTSSRRMEQVLRYINSSIPVKSTADAQALMRNVHSMFSDDEKTNKLWEKFNEPLKQLIKDTTPDNVKLGSIVPSPSIEWENTLKHQIENKMKMNKDRSYVPVIYGLPGVGKTSIIAKIASDLNLAFIKVDCQALDSTDIIGLPVGQTDDKSEISTEFTVPPLLKTIERERKLAVAKFKKQKSPEEISQWESQEHKYLLFFDELNKVHSQNAFNVLRRLVLEKEFNHQYKLSNKYIMVAAINPAKYGDKVHPMTGHLKDSIDLIEASPSIEKFKEYLDNLDSTEFKNIDPSTKRIAREILLDFIDQFGNKTAEATTDKHRESYPFYLKASKTGGEALDDMEHVPPRDYEDLYKYITTGLESALAEYQGEDPAQVSDDVSEYLMHNFYTVLSKLAHREDVDHSDFFEQIKSWLYNNMPKFLEGLATKPSIEAMVEYAIKNNKHVLNDPNWRKYIDPYIQHQFQDDLESYLEKKLTQLEEKHHIFSKDNVSAIQKIENKISVIDEYTNTLQRIIDELYHAASENNPKMVTDMHGPIKKIIRKINDDFAAKDPGDEGYDRLKNFMVNTALPRVRNILLSLRGNS